jgi:glutamine---fructose-6-phosphate transaminase (isomerizing)
MRNVEKQHQMSHTWNEIVSQGETWQTALDELSHSQVLSEILEHGPARRRIFVGCGSSYYLAQAAAVSWTNLTGQPARAIPASEVLLFPELVRADGTDLQAVAISRSGQTSETVRAASVLSEELRVPTIGLTCAPNSDLQTICHKTIVLNSADEKSMVMTRSFTSMLLSLQILPARGAGHSQFIDDLRRMAQEFTPRIHDHGEILEDFVARHTFADFVFLGQGAFHAIAQEAALKVMEMSRSYSQFFHTLEFRHGPKAIVTPATCLMFFLSDRGQKAEAEVLTEMKELGGTTVAICNHASDSVRAASDLTIETNLGVKELALLAPFTVPAQFLGYFIGTKKGLNPDEPTNLTRVVLLD